MSFDIGDYVVDLNPRHISYMMMGQVSSTSGGQLYVFVKELNKSLRYSMDSMGGVPVHNLHKIPQNTQSPRSSANLEAMNLSDDWPKILTFGVSDDVSSQKKGSRLSDIEMVNYWDREDMGVGVEVVNSIEDIKMVVMRELVDWKVFTGIIDKMAFSAHVSCEIYCSNTSS